MQHSENFVTDVLERVASTFVNETAPKGVPGWDALDMHQRMEIKQSLLPTVLAVLDAAKEVSGEADGAKAFAAGYEAGANFYSPWLQEGVRDHDLGDMQQALNDWRSH